MDSGIGDDWHKQAPIPSGSHTVTSWYKTNYLRQQKTVAYAEPRLRIAAKVVYN